MFKTNAEYADKFQDILIDYLTFIASQYMKEEKSQVNLGYWNPDVGIAENVIREHIPNTYTSWMFSDNPLNSLLHGPYKSREVLMPCDRDRP